ncbi:TetR/AcrR family transcriptional regulator [Asticcacaulis taihuensis]|uniref:TetR/AcrR family transcriptional regulator n=1 Tax=Asticcacaulis taihuensis TaxID=260084 RepID=UPI003F7C496C
MYDPHHPTDPVSETAIASDKPAPAGNRAKSKERNRLKILESAATLFRERGFEAATLRDIARAAGLSTGALFANFADKNEIFLTVLESENTRVIRTMRDALDEKLDLVSRLHTQLMRGYEATQHNARIVLSAFVMKWSQGQTPVNQVGQMSDLIRFVLLDTLKAAQARNEVPQSVNVECASEVLEDLCLANLRRAYQGSDDSGAFDMERLAKSLNAQIALVVAGLKAA